MAKEALVLEKDEADGMYRYSPNRPIGSNGNVAALFESMRGAMEKVLPRHVTSERMLKTLMLAVNKQPALLDCTQQSLYESLMRAGELGLEVSGTLGDAYLVPFNNSIKLPNGKFIKVRQATLIPGYRGLAKLARQSGTIKRIEAEAIHENDFFEYEKGENFKCRFVPAWKEDRGKVLAVYSLVEFKDGGIQADLMSAGDVEKVRQNANSTDSPAWTKHWTEMAKKTVFRRLCKWLELSGEKYEKLVKAIELDNEDYPSIGAAMDALPAAVSKVEALADRLAPPDEQDEDDQADEPGSEASDEAPMADSGAPMLTDEQIANVKAALARNPVVAVSDFEERWKSSIEDLTGPDGATNEAFYASVLQSVKELKQGSKK